MPTKLVAVRYDWGECDFHCHPSIEAAASAEASQRRRRFSMLAYDGGPLILPNYKYPVVVDLKGLELGDQVRPALLDHVRDSEHVIGQTDRIFASETELTAEGDVMAASPIALRAVELNDAGFNWKASIGAAPVVKPTLIQAGSSVQVNGRTFEGPIFVSTRTRLGEISFVVIGASKTSAAQIAASAAGDAMTFEQFVQQAGFDPATLTEAQRTFFQSLYEQQGQGTPADETQASGGGSAPPPRPNPAPAPNVNANGNDLEIQASDRNAIQRGNAIRAICYSGRGNFPEIEAQAIEGNWDLKATQLAVIRAARPNAPNIIVRTNERNQGVIEASLAVACGLDPNLILERGWYDERTITAADSMNWRNMSLVRLGHEIVAMAGGHLRPGKLDPEGIRHIFECDRRNTEHSWDIQAHGSGGVSTVSLAGSLGNVMHKVLLNSFLQVDTVIPEISVKQSPTDYKDFKSFMINMSGDLEEVGPNGQLPDISLGEEEWSNRARIKGAYLSISEEHFVNDDIGVWSLVPKLMGRKAAIGREKSGNLVFMSNPVGVDGNLFFSAANGNYLEGAEYALSIDALTAANQLAKEQNDNSEDADPILLPMTRIYTPPSLDVIAGSLYKKDTIVIAGSTNKTQTADNPHVGSFEPIGSPFLGEKFRVPGADNKAYYLLPAKGDIMPLQAAYLNGNELPTVEKGEVDFRTLGMAWRIVYRLGFAKGNKRSVVKVLGRTP